MAAKSIVERLKSLPDSVFSKLPPGNERDLRALEREYKLKLPQDYKDYILLSNGGSIHAGGSVLHIDPADEALGMNMNEDYENYLPGMFMFGGDGGGSVYFYDPKNRFGKGAYAVFLVEEGSLQPRDVIFVGKDLTEVIESVLNKEEFHDRPRYGKDLAS
jgi:hypothetical protein